MRILFLNPHVPEHIGYTDGRDFVTKAESHQRYCKIAEDLGHDIRFGYLSKEYEQYEHPKFGHPVEGFPVSFKLPYMEISLPLLSHVLKESYDLLYVNTVYSHRVLPILLSARAAQTPIVLHHHGDIETEFRFELQRKALELILPRDEYQIFCVNQKASNQLENAGFEHVEELAFGVDTTLFSPDPQSDSKNVLDSSNGDGIDALFVGRIKKIKGIFDLLEAQERLCESEREITLHMIYGGADDETLDEFKAQTDKRGLSDSVNLVGRVDRTLLPEYYRAADFCVFPSIREGFGMVPIEAMACGTPTIVTTTHLDAGHKFTSGEDVLVVEPGDVDSLASAMTDLVEDKELRERLSKNSVETIERDYTWEGVKARLETLFEQFD